LKPRLARLLASEVQRRRRDPTLDALNLLQWGKRFLPHHCERPFSALHEWLAGELDQADRQRGRKVNLIGPRGAEVLWPSEEPLYRLMQMRAEEGHTAFEREKHNSQIAPERCEWPEDYFDERIWYRDKPTGTL
jgi:hypothetical protein